MAGENLDLKIIIDTLLHAKGFEEAQAGLNTLTSTTNQAALSAENAAGKQRGLSRELGGTRGPVADLTRLLLMNIGVTGAAGETAKAAGMAMMAMGGSVGLVSLGAVALVAAVALLLPKLKEWSISADEIEKINAGITKELAAQFPGLEEYVIKVANVSAAIREQYDAVKLLLKAQQQLEFIDLAAKIAEHEKQYKKLVESISASGPIWRRVIGLEDNSATATTRRAAESRVLEATLKQERARLDELSVALRTGTVAALVRAEAISKSEEADRIAKKALDDRLKSEERLKKIQEESIRVAFKIKADKAKAEAEEKKQHRADMDRAAERLLAIQKEKGAVLDEAHAAIAAKRQENVAATQNAIAAGNMLTSLFTQNKAVRIAMALADTYAAAMAAAAETQGNVYVRIAAAAAVVAQGLIYVANIRKTEPGFDDPFNDMLASQLGRKSAADFVQHFGTGFREGMSGGRGGTSIQNTTINRGTTMNVTANGIIGSRTAFRSWLEREMTLAERMRARKTI